MGTAAGTYARAIFPDALSKTDPHPSDLQKAMLDATPDCIKVVSVDGKLLAMNRAGHVALNVPEDSELGMPWLPLLPEEVHPLGIEALRKVARGHSARFPGRSEAPGSLIYWDNLLTPVVDASGQVLSILCVSRDVTEKVKLDGQLEEAIDREKLLSSELRHRVKNLFSVVSGLTFVAQQEADKDNAPGTGTKILQAKLDALSRASDLAFWPSDDADGGASRIDLACLVRALLLPYGDRFAGVGDPASIRRAEMTNLALLLHELATNSVKYGALGADGGKVTLLWSARGEWLELTWIESGGPPIGASPTQRGFGSEMTDRLVRSVGGEIRRMWRPEGLVVHLRLPMTPAIS